MSEMELIEAAKAGNASAVKQLLETGADVNHLDKDGWTALNWAAGKGDLEMIRLLLEHGADVFKVGTDLRTPRMIALAAGQVEAVRLLREAEDSQEGERPTKPQREYAKAFYLSELRRFPGWVEISAGRKEASANGSHSSNGAGPNGDGAHATDEVVFLHGDYTVSLSFRRGEDVIFDHVTPEWIEFCNTDLQFRVPDELELVGAAQSV
jgi:uncharacterized protein